MARHRDACMMREARLALSPMEGTRWSARGGAFSPAESPPHADRLHRALMELKTDLPGRRIPGAPFCRSAYGGLRQEIRRMVEGL